MTPDSAKVSARILVNPQRWDRYVYVIDNPLTRVDPDGLSDVLVFVIRQAETSKSTIGTLRVVTPTQVLTGATLELPWRDNRPFVSRIPAGVYRADEVRSEKDGTPAVLKLRDVPGHSGIYQHIGNWPKNSKGCTLVGTRRARVLNMILGSATMLKRMHKAIDAVKKGDAAKKETTKIFTIYLDPAPVCSTYSISVACQELADNNRAYSTRKRP